MPRRFRDETSAKKVVLLLGLTFLLTGMTSVALTAFPQHLVLTKNTSIAAVRFSDSNHVVIKGHQVSYATGDIIPLGSSRDFIKITGRQIQVGAETYKEGVRSIPSGWSQNVLFLQKVGTFDTNTSRAAQLIIDNAIINLIPVSSDVLNVNTVDIGAKEQANSYNLQYQSGAAYINERGVMLKLVKDKTKTTVYIVGFSHYSKIFLRTL